MARFAESRKVLLDERDAARKDSRLRARFMSYRLNIPTGDESDTLLTVDDWERTLSRDVAERMGRPIVGIDLGGGRAWSAAVAVWQTGRIEAVAVCPGIPDIEAQEKRDRVPSGTYQWLLDSGRLFMADGKRVPEVGSVVRAVESLMGVPRLRGLRQVQACGTPGRRAAMENRAEGVPVERVERRHTRA